MSPTVSIRPAEATDAAAIAELSTQLGYSSARSDIARRIGPILGSGEDMAAVAEDGGRILGWIHVAVARRLESDAFVEIGGLVVSDAARRRGIGRALVAAAEAWARGKGIDRIRVRSRTERAEAHEFYRRLGYRNTKTQMVFGKQLEPRGQA